MAKILKDKELLAIVKRTIEGDEIDDQDQYLKFLQDLGGVIANHFGGQIGNADIEPSDGEYYVAFHLTEEVPEDGGIYKDFDKDVAWEDGKES